MNVPDDRSSLDYQRRLLDLKLEHAREVYGYAATYDNAIVLAGYAAFFGLWAGVNQDVTVECRDITAALIGVSLICYILWHIVQMLHRQAHELAKAGAFELHERDPVTLFRELDKLKEKWNRDWVKLLRLWNPLFLASIGFGFGGALVLVWNVTVRALGIPLQFDL
jgi:hypothetical protein